MLGCYLFFKLFDVTCSKLHPEIGELQALHWGKPERLRDVFDPLLTLLGLKTWISVIVGASPPKEPVNHEVCSIYKWGMTWYDMVWHGMTCMFHCFCLWVIGPWLPWLWPPGCTFFCWNFSAGIEVAKTLVMWSMIISSLSPVYNWKNVYWGQWLYTYIYITQRILWDLT